MHKTHTSSLPSTPVVKKIIKPSSPSSSVTSIRSASSSPNHERSPRIVRKIITVRKSTSNNISSSPSDDPSNDLSATPAVHNSDVTDSIEETCTKFLLGWHSGNQGQLHPVKRQGHTCVSYHSLMILYGGVASGQPTNDMWFLDTIKMRWSRFEPIDNPSPGKRTGHSTIVIKDRMYLFGGDDGKNCLNDLWQFDIGNRVWSKIEYVSRDRAPQPRCGHACITYGNTLIVYGGADRMSTIFGDLWQLDLTSKRWTRIDNDNAPSRRHGHTLTSVDDCAILFGGYGPGGRLNDTWKLDPVSLCWNLIDIPGNKPSKRSHHSAVPLVNKLMLFGGLSSTANQELWELSLTNQRWNRIELSKNPNKLDNYISGGNILNPSPRFAHTACLFRGLRMFIFGGVGDNNEYRDDLWYLYIDPSLETKLEDDEEIHSHRFYLNKIGSQAEDIKNWKRAHDRTMSILDQVRTEFDEEKKAWREEKARSPQNDKQMKEFDSRLKNFEKRVKEVKSQDYESTKRNIQDLESSVRTLRDSQHRHEQLLEFSKSDTTSLEKRLTLLENSYIETVAATKSQKPAEKGFENLGKLEESLREELVRLSSSSKKMESDMKKNMDMSRESYEKSKTHYKRMKFNMEQSLSDMKKEIEEEQKANKKNVTSMFQEESRNLEDKINKKLDQMEKNGFVVRTTPGDFTKSEFREELSNLEKKIEKEQLEYRKTIERKIRDDDFISDKIQEHTKVIRSEFDDHRKKSDGRFGEISKWQADYSQREQKWREKIELQETQIQKEREERIKLETAVADLNKSFEERIKLSEKKQKSAIREKSIAEETDNETRFLKMETKLDGFSKEIKQLDKQLRRDMENQFSEKDERDNKDRKVFKEKIEYRLDSIRSEVEDLLDAITDREIEESEKVEEFAKKLITTLNSTNNLQSSIAKLSSSEKSDSESIVTDDD